VQGGEGKERQDNGGMRREKGRGREWRGGDPACIFKFSFSPMKSSALHAVQYAT